MDKPVAPDDDPDIPTSLDDLFRHYYRDVLLYVIRRVSHRADADEIASEVFEIACNRHDDTAITRAWLLKTAKNRIAKRHARAQREDRRFRLLVSDYRANTPSPSAAEGDFTALARALAGLRDKDREVLTMTYWDRLTSTEIAEVVGASIPTVNRRRRRAEQRIKKALVGADTTEGGTVALA